MMNVYNFTYSFNLLRRLSLGYIDLCIYTSLKRINELITGSQKYFILLQLISHLFLKLNILTNISTILATILHLKQQFLSDEVTS